jgi:orotidine-5'-phosphate decarboxylase
MGKQDNTSKVIVALDTSSKEVAKKLLKELDGVITYYKIGFELFTAHGWEAVEWVRKRKGQVFLDLKLHDIPTTVSKTAAVICEHDVEMFNVHTLGGLEMMKLARKTVDERSKPGKKKPIVLGVTILTSHTPEDLSKDLGISRNLNDQVVHLAKLAQKAGLDGVVCSPLEIELIRKALGPDFKIVTPGIRGAKDAKGDQKRTFSPAEALEAGSDYMVIGRPITAAENPRKEAEAILQTLS